MIRSRVERAMRGESVGLGPRVFLSALSAVYGTGVGLRGFLYSSGVLKARRLPCRVISVGNITVGGTGKTPVAIFIAGLLKDKGHKTVILSRGYGGSAKGPALVSDGDKVLLSPDEAGDEPCLMAGRLKGVPVVVCPDRVKGGLFALERFSPEFIVLDDGFQHRRLERDFNIVLVDANEGFGNGRLLPRGILREPPGALSRADLAMVKGGEPSPDVKRTFERLAIPFLVFKYAPKDIVEISSGDSKPLSYIRGKSAVAVAGLANPDSFFSTIESLGVQITKKLKYPDHHPYSKSDIEKIMDEAKGAGIVITTEKDAVKLKGLSGGLPMYALRIDAEADAERFSALLASRLREAR